MESSNNSEHTLKLLSPYVVGPLPWLQGRCRAVTSFPEETGAKLSSVQTRVRRDLEVTFPAHVEQLKRNQKNLSQSMFALTKFHVTSRHVTSVLLVCNCIYIHTYGIPYHVGEKATPDAAHICSSVSPLH